MILAVGITGNVEDLGLEGTGVRVERGHIVVNEWLETDEPGVYAIGDVVGPPWLAHKASHEGVICVEHIAGVEGVQPLDPPPIPACTYCRPQIASVGLTEAAARDGGREVRVGRFPYQANGKAIALGETEGLVKTIFDAAHRRAARRAPVRRRGHRAHPGLRDRAGRSRRTEAELIHTVFPHPTLSETMHESVLAAYGRALHV